MTSVDEFVRTNILTFPSLFPHRTAVLHHALCVIGNGYHWSSDGTVVSDFREECPLWDKETKLAEVETDINRSFKNADTREYIMEAMRKDIEATAEIIEQVESRIHHRVDVTRIYPQSDYALLMNIPANVTEDWKEACEEMKIMATKEGWKF